MTEAQLDKALEEYALHLGMGPAQMDVFKRMLESEGRQTPEQVESELADMMRKMSAAFRQGEAKALIGVDTPNPYTDDPNKRDWALGYRIGKKTKESA